jgi:hypothetical protein
MGARASRRLADTEAGDMTAMSDDDATLTEDATRSGTCISPQTARLLAEIRELLCDVMAASDFGERTIADDVVEIVHQTILRIDRAMEAAR